MRVLESPLPLFEEGSRERSLSMENLLSGDRDIPATDADDGDDDEEDIDEEDEDADEVDDDLLTDDSERVALADEFMRSDVGEMDRKVEGERKKKTRKTR